MCNTPQAYLYILNHLYRIRTAQVRLLQRGPVGDFGVRVLLPLRLSVRHGAQPVPCVTPARGARPNPEVVRSVVMSVCLQIMLGKAFEQHNIRYDVLEQMTMFCSLSCEVSTVMYAYV